MIINKKTLLFAVAALMSNIVRENVFLSYASMGPSYKSWIGSGAFSVAVAVFLSSLVKIPSPQEDNPTPVLLYVYYSAMSMLVSALALKLIWIPVIDLVSELNMILSKMVLYFNKSIFPRTRHNVVKQLGVFLGTKNALIWSTNLIGLLFLYAVSADVMNYMGVYINSIQSSRMFARL